jgi:cbb3-type cytochrome oxidase subunit 3
MSLGDVVGHAGLGRFTEIAMILFMIAFVGIVVRTFLPRRRREFDEASRLPLDDEHRGPAGPGADA